MKTISITRWNDGTYRPRVKCKKCGHSIKAPYNAPSGRDYMTEAVVLRIARMPVIGEYDGYGRVGAFEVTAYGDDGEPEMWHKRCWEDAGKPEYIGGSDALGGAK